MKSEDDKEGTKAMTKVAKCTHGDGVVVNELFPAITECRSLRDWISRNGDRVPLPPFPFLRGIDLGGVMLNCGHDTVFSVGEHVDCVAGVCVSPQNPNVIVYDVTISTTHSGIGKVVWLKCNDVIAMGEGPITLCQRLARTRCALIKSARASGSKKG